MKLIDIEPLKERIDKEVKEGKVLDGWAFFIKAYLDDEPNIDIVRCKECKHSCGVLKYCAIDHWVGDDDDFCSYGVKKGADDE